MHTFVNFWVDDIYTSVPKTFTILQACSVSGLEVPRFCYHEKLSIAGNCRMCLVEVNNSKKLVASCAVPISENLKVYTNNLRVKKARESVLEFLLANHPLDCPICDQGGECDLQDITVAFGSDRGRFYELEKRAVEDKYCGPLIKTVMTRCIHCTRCIRFISEVSGYPDMGTTGRGTRMEVGTYVTKALTDELSSNIIDLCPVGALTSKPYSFTSRPWELNGVESIDIFDVLCSNIKLNIYGNKIKRILPRINENLNEDWLSNKTRYIYDSFELQRVTSPLLNFSFSSFFLNSGLNRNFWVSTSWKQVLLCSLYFLNNLKLDFVFGPHQDLETIFFFKKNFSSLGLLSSRSYSNDYSSSYFSSIRVKEIETYSSFLSVNVYLRNEVPLINTRVRKSSNYYMSSFKFFCVGVGVNYYTYPVKLISNNTNSLNKILCGKTIISKLLLKLKSNFVYFYKQNYFKFLGKIFNLSFQPHYVKIDNSTFDLTSSHLGFKPSDSAVNLHSNKLKYSYSIGFDLDKEYYPLIYQGHHGNSMTSSSVVVMPAAIFTEKSSNFLNLEGLVQKANAGVSPDKLVKKDWEIFRALADFASLMKFSKVNELFNYIGQLDYKNLDQPIYPYWVEGTSYYCSPLENGNFLRNYLFSIKILNYYWNDLFSQNSKIMAKCASLINVSNVSYK